MSTALPALTRELTNESLLSTFLLPPEHAKIQFQLAPLMMLAKENPDLQAMDFINFIRLAQKTGADPERKHIHLITTRKKVKKWNPMTRTQDEEWITKGEAWFSYHYFVGKAQETGELTFMDVITEPCDYLNPASGQLIKNTIKAVCTVKRKSKSTGIEQTYVYRAYFPEFVKTKEIYQGGQATGQYQVTEAWLQKPYLMLEKCAVANALRWAFEAELSGMYIPEEMAGEFSPTTTAEPSMRDIHANVAPKPVEVVEAKVAEVVDVPQESQLVAQDDDVPLDTEYQEMGQPDPEPVHTAPQPAPQPQAAQGPTPQADMCSKRTKALLWSRMQGAAHRKLIALEPSIKKLETATLTEDLANQLIAQLDQGNVGWFTA